MKKLLFLLLVVTFLYAGAVYGHELDLEKRCDEGDKTCYNNVEDHNDAHRRAFIEAYKEAEKDCDNRGYRWDRTAGGWCLKLDGFQHHNMSDVYSY